MEKENFLIDIFSLIIDDTYLTRNTFMKSLSFKECLGISFISKLDTKHVCNVFSEVLCMLCIVANGIFIFVMCSLNNTIVLWLQATSRCYKGWGFVSVRIQHSHALSGTATEQHSIARCVTAITGAKFNKPFNPR